MRKEILVVDDEKLIRLSLADCLDREGYGVTAVGTGKEALEYLAKDSYDLVLLDYMLPDTDGLELLEEFREAELGLTVIMMTSHSSLDHAVQAVRAGAIDYVAKPFQEEDIILRVARALEAADLKYQVTRLRREQRRRFSLKNFVGRSPALDSVFSVVERILQTGDVTVLIQGESGTGKDVLARSLHFEGPRADRPFMNITCTALPESLLESELFGHEKGSFTDARSLKKGLLELADGGTVFLDEIGDMTANLQAKLLRFLEEKTFRRVGASKDLSVDLRVIAATNRNLKSMVKQGNFREDLYFRLNVIPIHLPPLRDRKEDIPLLVDHFIGLFNNELKTDVKGVTPDLLKQLKRYPWPGKHSGAQEHDRAGHDSRERRDSGRGRPSS